MFVPAGSVMLRMRRDGYITDDFKYVLSLVSSVCTDALLWVCLPMDARATLRWGEII